MCLAMYQGFPGVKLKKTGGDGHRHDSMRFLKKSQGPTGSYPPRRPSHTMQPPINKRLFEARQGVMLLMFFFFAHSYPALWPEQPFVQG